MRLGYNTNGLPHHRWDEAVELIAATGYRSVALTIDHHCLDPRAPQLAEEVARLRELLARHNLRCVIETGARFLLDPARKHQPTLLSPTPDERDRRLAFLRHAVDVAAAVGADAVSFWSGTPVDDATNETCWTRLVEGCRRLVDHAAQRDIRLAFEPEPGMFLETMAQFARLRAAVDHPDFGLTLDVGHVHCLGDGDIAEHIRAFRHVLWNLHLEDMRPGVHDHLPFGEGTIDFAPIFAALREIGYAGGVHVELSRHGHVAPTMLRESFAFLRESMSE